MEESTDCQNQLSFRDKEAIDKLLQDDYEMSEEEGMTE